MGVAAGLCFVFHPSLALPANANDDEGSPSAHSGRLSMGFQEHFLSTQGGRPFGWIAVDHEIPAEEGLLREVGATLTGLERFGLKEFTPEIHYLTRNDAHDGFRASLQGAPSVQLLPRFQIEGEGMFASQPRFSSFVGGRLQYFAAATGVSIWFGSEWGFSPGWSVWGRMLLSTVGYRAVRQTQIFPATQFRLYRYFSDDLIAFVGVSYGQEGFVLTIPPSVGYVSSKGGGFGVRYRFDPDWEIGALVDVQHRGDQSVHWWTTVGTEIRYFFE